MTVEGCRNEFKRKKSKWEEGEFETLGWCCCRRLIYVDGYYQRTTGNPSSNSCNNNLFVVDSKSLKNFKVNPSSCGIYNNLMYMQQVCRQFT